MNAGNELQAPPENLLAGRKVVFVLNDLNLGGAERQALLLARHLRDVAGAQVQIWGFANPGLTSKLCEEYGIPWRIVPFSWTSSRLRQLGRLLKFARELRSAKVELLLPYIMMPNLVCGVLWRWVGAWTCLWQQRDAGLFRRAGTVVERLALRWTPCFVSNSDHGAQFLINTLAVDPRRVHVVRNGVHLAAPSKSRTTWRSTLGIPPDRLAACMVANLTTFKDHETLIRAWRLVVDQMRDLSCQPILLLAGRKEKTYEALKSLTGTLRLEPVVRFLGEVDDVPGLLGSVDLGVFSSRLEGCPNAVLECMASGLALAATDIPGIRETLGGDGMEHVAPMGDHEKLAGRIAALLGNAELRTRVGRANQMRVNKEFSVERMCQETVAVVKDALTRNGAA